MNSLELKQERAKTLEEAQALLANADKEQRDFNPEETELWTTLTDKAENLKLDIQKAERKEYISNAQDELKNVSQRKTQATASKSAHVNERTATDAFRAWLMYGSQNVPDSYMQAAYDCGVNLRSKSINLVPERRALAVGSATAGAEFVAEEFLRECQAALKAFGGVRSVARIISTSQGGDLVIPTMDDTSNTGEIVAEAGSIGSSVDPTTGSKTMLAYKYSSKAVLVSSEMLQDSQFPLQSLLSEALGTRIGRIQNTHFTTGDNSSKPQGVVVGSAEGIDTTDGAITYPDLIDLMVSVNRAYYQPGKVYWMCNSATKAYLMKLVDDNSRPLWLPNIIGGAPDTLLGFPIVVNDDMASIAADAKCLLFGNFEKAYFIRDTAGFSFVRLDELYAANGQVGFIAFKRSDGRTVNANAVKHLKT